jgi:hypothetical protein
LRSSSFKMLRCRASAMDPSHYSWDKSNAVRLAGEINLALWQGII